MRLNATRNHSTASTERSIACKTITTNAAFLHRVDQHLRCVSTHNVRACCILHPTPPSRVGKQWEMNEPPKPLRRVNINHTNTRSGMQLRSHCFASLQPWYLGQFKPPKGGGWEKKLLRTTSVVPCSIDALAQLQLTRHRRLLLGSLDPNL